MLWSPPEAVWSTPAAGRFARRHGHGSYADLWAWSVEDLEGFWVAVVEDRDVIWHDPPDRVLADGDRAMPGARWFPGATLSYAEHALRHWRAPPPRGAGGGPPKTVWWPPPPRRIPTTGRGRGTFTSSAEG